MPSVAAFLSRPRLPVLLALVLGAAALLACGDGGEPEVEHVTFMAGFRPQANLPFVAVYVAEAKGYFEDEGLDVEIQHSSGDEHLKLLLDGEIQFTTATAAQVARRVDTGLPVRAIALFGQRGDQGYVAMADSGIDGPEDFTGHTVGFKSGVVPAELQAMLANAGVAESDVELVGVGFDPRVFMEEQVDVYPVFVGNEPDTIQRAGFDINVIDPHDFGVPTLGVTYLTLAETAEDRDLVERFLRATFRAVAWIDGHRDEAVEITLGYAEGADPEHQRFLLDADLAAATRDDGRWGLSDVDAWVSLGELLQTYDLIEQPLDPAAVIDQSVLEALYDEGEIE